VQDLEVVLKLSFFFFLIFFFAGHWKRVIFKVLVKSVEKFHLRD